MILAEGGRRGAVAQHDERRRKTLRATRFRRAALFAERLEGTGKKVKGREICGDSPLKFHDNWMVPILICGDRPR